ESVGGAEQYLSAKIGDLTSPPIAIPGNSQKPYYLRFYYQYQTETENQDWDQRWIQISKDGGAYENILQQSDDLMGVWLHSQAINLSAYAGHTIRIRFHFDTIDLRFNAYSGWYIDDVGISIDALPACAPEGSEPNNTPAQAAAIAYGQSLPNDEICPGGDMDYYKFTGNAGDRVVVDIDAQSIGSSLDSIAYLLNSDGKTVLAYSDDEQPGLRLDPHLSYVLPSSGIYYLKVRAWNNPSVGGSAYFYHMRLFTDAQKPVASISSPASGSYLKKNPLTIQVNAQDSLSGVSRVDFYWHSDSWLNSDWVFIGSDTDGNDGWSMQFDPGSGYDERAAAFYAHIYDWAGNWIGAGTWNISLDSTPPDVAVFPVVTDPGSTAFQVIWTGSDALSGIDHYDVQVSADDNLHWQDLVTSTPSTSIWYAGQAGHSYYFRVRGIDRVGNMSVYMATTAPAAISTNICTKFDSYDNPTNDNTVNLATLTTPGANLQFHNFCNPLSASRLNDTDWVKFYARGGKPYVIQAIPVGPSVSVAIDLFDSDGLILRKHASPTGYGMPTSMLFAPIKDGMYAVRLTDTNGAIAGSQVAFQLRLTEGFRIYFSQVKSAP
ncbi:MAG: Ig-like domain-containing protein, partial [Omnitrophica WOR_2 bacterium]